MLQEIVEMVEEPCRGATVTDAMIATNRDRQRAARVTRCFIRPWPSRNSSAADDRDLRRVDDWLQRVGRAFAEIG